MRLDMRTGAALGALLLGLGSAAAAQQSLAARIDAAPDGAVRFSFASRKGVCGNGRNIITQRDTDDWEGTCESGPVRVVLTRRDRRVTDIETYVGGRWRGSGATDLGQVPAREAAEYLVALAERSDRDGNDAVLPATLADSVTIWPALLRLARNESASQHARKSSVFWLGQMAGDVATRNLDSIVSDDSGDREVRKSAIFALSQRPKDEGVPALIRVARSSHDPDLRKSALFWLGQSEDPRALKLFEELLTGS
jgi:hypothetical protein